MRYGENAEVLRDAVTRLKRAHGQLGAVIAMIEDGDSLLTEEQLEKLFMALP